MEKKWGILLVLFLLLTVPSVYGETNKDHKVFFFPTGNFYENIDSQNLFRQEGLVSGYIGRNDADPADFDKFLKEKGIELVIQDPLFDPTKYGVVDRVKGAELIY